MVQVAAHVIIYSKTKLLITIENRDAWQIGSWRKTDYWIESSLTTIIQTL